MKHQTTHLIHNLFDCHECTFDDGQPSFERHASILLLAHTPLGVMAFDLLGLEWAREFGFVDEAS